MYSWHDFNKYKIYDTDAHLNLVNRAKSKPNPSRRVAFASGGATHSRSPARNSKRVTIVSNGRPPVRGPQALSVLSNKQDAAVQGRRQINGSFQLFGSNLIGHERHSHLNVSETRAAFNVPLQRGVNENNGSRSRNSRMYDKVSAERRTKPNFQETPPFSLRKTPTVVKYKNKVIDVNKVLAAKKNTDTGPTSSAQRPEDTERTLFVHKGISSFSTPHNPGPPFNSFGLLDDPKTFVLGAASDSTSADERFRFIVDMSEYHNDQIRFVVKGKKLIIEGNRPQQKPWMSERRTTELVDLPPHVQADNLRVARDLNGLLYFQEAWKF